MDNNFRKKIILTIGFGVAIVLFLIILLFFFGREIASLSKNIVESRQQIEKQNRDTALFFELRQNFETAKGYEKFLNQVLPQREEIFLFKEEVNKISVANNLEHSSFNFGSESLGPEDLFGKVKFVVYAEGEYQNILSFLKDLEKSRYFINLSNFDIIRREDGRFQGYFNGYVFFRS